MSKKPKKIDSTKEAHDRMWEIRTKVKNLLMSETKKLHDENRFLIIGRVLNTLFYEFYLPTISYAEERLRGHEEAARAKK